MVQFAHRMNLNSHKLNWRKSKIHFSNSIRRKSVIEFVIERSGAHKRKQEWNKIECSNFELLMADTLLRTACPKCNQEFKFFCKCWSPFDFVFQDYSSGTELTKKFCVKFCFMAVTASNSFVRRSSIEISWVRWKFCSILFGVIRQALYSALTDSSPLTVKGYPVKMSSNLPSKHFCLS